MQPQAPATAPATAPPAQQSTHDLLHQITDVTVKTQMEELVYAGQVARAMAASGYWKDTENIPQAITKVMIGKELGIPPMVSVMNISIQNGRVGFSAELIAALLKRSGYTWKFVENSATKCEIACYKDGSPILNEDGKPARVTWTIEDAKTAKLTEPRGATKEISVYEKYAADMLFWRVITRFMRRYAPEVTKGFAGYTPDEMLEIEQADIEAAKTAVDGGLEKATRENAKKLKDRLEAAKVPADEEMVA